jgi:uncharacterized protein YdcH (DUF465 family)
MRYSTVTLGCVALALLVSSCPIVKAAPVVLDIFKLGPNLEEHCNEASLSSVRYAGDGTIEFREDIYGICGNPEPVLSFQVFTKNVEQFRARYPNQFENGFRQYMEVSTFREKLYPAANTTWQLFLADYTATEEEKQDFEAAVIQATSPNWAVREDAVKKLRNPHYYSLLRTVDRTKLTPEQQVLISRAANSLTSLSDSEIELLKKDNLFLQDAMRKADTKLRFAILKQFIKNLQGKH